MKRREFIKGAAAAGVATAAATTLAAPALSQGRKEIKMITSWPKNFPGLGTSANRLAQRIGAMTDGRITARVYAAGELVGAFENFDAVASGNGESYHATEYYFQGKNKAFNFFSTVPFGMTANEHTAWIRFGGGQELWDELSGEFGLKSFMAGNTGVQAGGWFAKEINTLDDLKGLKYRMPGLGGETLRRLGAAVVNLPGGEIFTSLQSGAIDGTEWVGPWNDLAMGFYKVVKFYYWPGFHEPGTTLSFSLNRKFWDDLSDADKAMIESATAAENETVLAEFNGKNSAALTTLVNDHGVQVRRWSDEILNQMGTVAGEVVAEVRDEGGIAAKVVDSFFAFRKNALAMTSLGDQAFLNARSLPFKYG